MLPDLPRLRTLTSADAEVHQLLTAAGTHRVRDGVTTVQYLAKKLHGYRAGYDVFQSCLAALRRIEQTGMGQLLEASVRQRARFVWSVHPETLLHALREKTFVLQTQHLLESGPAFGDAIGEPVVQTTPLAAPVPPPAGPAEWLRHTFSLRPGVKIQLALPADLTPAEAERLAHLLRACAAAPQPPAV